MLTAKYGADIAFEIRREGIRALDYIEDFIRREGLKVNWERDGRFHGAHNARRYELLAQTRRRRAEGTQERRLHGAARRAAQGNR